MGMRPDDFNDLTPAEFFYAWAGWAKANIDRQKQEWERTRWQTWVLTCIQLEKKDRKEMVEMFPLPWETPPPPKIIPSAELSDEERNERVNEMMKCVAPKKD